MSASLVSTNTGCGIPAKPPAWDCGMNHASLPEQTCCGGYSIQALPADSNSARCTALLAVTSQEEQGFKESCTHLRAFKGGMACSGMGLKLLESCM